MQRHTGQKIKKADGRFLVVHPGNWESIYNNFIGVLEGKSNFQEALEELRLDCKDL